MTRRAAVVGSGFIGAGAVVPEAGIQSHAAAWTQHPATSLVAVCDADPEVAMRAGEKWRTSAYTGLAEMLNKAHPEIVSIATPDETHASILDRVLDAPSVKAILAEKPLALDVEEAERLVEKAASRGIVLAVNYVRRYAPSHRRLAEWLATGPIGRIEVVRGSYVRGIKHNGTHWIDLARFLVGEIENIAGRGPVPEGALDATIDVDLQFTTGARGGLTGIASAPFSLFEMDLIGAQGRVRITEGGQRIEAFGVVASRRFPGFKELAPVESPEGGLRDLLLHAAGDLIDALATGREPAGRGVDAVIALRLAHQALESARAGREAYADFGR